MSHGLLEFAKRQQRDEAEVDMGEPARLERDPVCGMMVDQWALQALHRGVGYAFCSEQCRERFVSAPGLYVGRKPLAPKQKGMVVVKRRRIVLGAPLTQAQFTELNGALLSMMGVTAVRSGEPMVDSGRDLQHTESESGVTDRIEVLEITYDLLQATALQLECKIVERNATLSNAWGEKLQRDFIHYLQQCELEDLAIRPPPLRRDVRSARATSRAASKERSERDTRAKGAAQADHAGDRDSPSRSSGRPGFDAYRHLHQRCHFMARGN